MLIPRIGRRHHAGLAIALLAAGTAGAATVDKLEVDPGMAAIQEPVERIRVLQREGRIEESLAQAIRLVEEVERRFSAESLEYATALDVLLDSKMADSAGTAEIVRLNERVVSIRERLQPDSVPLGASLMRLAQSQYYVDPAAALETQIRAVEIFRVAPSYENYYQGMSLWLLAHLYDRNGQGDKGIPALEEALEIFTRQHGPQHASVAYMLEQLAWFLPPRDPRRMPLAERALGIRRALAERTDPTERRGLRERVWLDVSNSLLTLADVHREEGRLVAATRLIEEALAVMRERSATDKYPAAIALENLAEVLRMRGALGEARLVYERSIGILERDLGQDHDVLGTPLRSLGSIYAEIGDFAHAIELYRRVLGLHADRPTDPTEVADLHYALSEALLESGQREPSRAHFERALAIAARLDHGERIAGRTHLARAEGLLRRGSIAQARSSAEAAHELLSGAVPDASIEVGRALGVLGATMARGAELEAGIERIERGLAILDAAESFRGPQSWELRVELAIAYSRDGRRERAIATALDAERRAREQFRESTTVFSEREALQYRSRLVSGADVALSVIVEAGRDASGDLVRSVFDDVIQSRALVLDEMASRHPAHYGPLAPRLTELHERVALAREQLSRLTVRADDGDPAEPLRKAWTALESAERELGEASRSFRERLRRFSIGVREVEHELPAGAVLVAYRHYAPVPGGGAAATTPGGAYVAFVLGAGRPEPSVVHLGTGEEIDRLVEAWRSGLSDPPPPGLRAAREAEHRHREVGHALREQVWDPIAERLGADPALVLVVPDGGLSLINLGALPTRDDAYLVERVTLHHLAAERDLVVDRASGSGAGFVAFGAPDFDRGPLEAETRSAPAQAAALFRGERSSCAELRRRRFAPLQGAAAEVREIADLWTTRATGGGGGGAGAIVLTGDRATEAAVKAMAPRSRVLHFATHGFVSAAGCASVLSPLDPASLGETRTLENPLLQSGLALAGANRREERADDAAREDGMLTAQEVASLDLSGVEWVVLSACETGVGSVVSSEGVLGLRRAFQVAGARTVIMSLWNVGDESSREWMREAYGARLDGADTARSVREASVAVLERRRRAGLPTHPFYWAAFIAAGDWR